MENLRKTCASCGKSLPLESFNKRSASKDGLQPWCRQCNRKRSREYYAKNKEKVKQQVYASRAKRKNVLRNKVLGYLSENPCVTCGFTDPSALEFDHISPQEKHLDISAMIRDGYSWGSVKEEIDKCQVLCANCHRIKTAQDQGWYTLGEVDEELLRAEIIPRRSR